MVAGRDEDLIRNVASAVSRGKECRPLSVMSGMPPA
jgi:hypothetical protein